MTYKAIEVFRGGLDKVCDERWFRLYGNCLCVLALVVAKYGAGFTWRQVLIGVVAFAVWHSGAELLRHSEKTRKFQRVQFRIGLAHFGQALVDAGIYSEDEVKQNSSALWESLGAYSSGYITFTWLQPDLFFMNTSSQFAEFAETTIYLKPFGDRALKIGKSLPDSLELRGKDEYELVLSKVEDRGPMGEEGHTLVLMKLPYEFFRSLQEPTNWNLRRIADYHKRQDEILERVGLKRWQDDEVSDAWDYRGKYAELHWWTF